VKLDLDEIEKRADDALARVLIVGEDPDDSELAHVAGLAVDLVARVRELEAALRDALDHATTHLPEDLAVMVRCRRVLTGKTDPASCSTCGGSRIVMDDDDGRTRDVEITCPDCSVGP
jgi:hypothetical protein